MTVLARRRIVVTGLVQGVGFRPFVHRVAMTHGLTGFVGNDAGAVFVEAQGDTGALDAFQADLTGGAPAQAMVTAVGATPLHLVPAEQGFRIVPSETGSRATALVPPDLATCDACLSDLRDPTNRRYRHPFVTCTDCGPRFSIVTGLPYDRPRTTMTGFAMCPACAAEYDDPADRRFHAQPISCPDCGPRLRFGPATGDAALVAAVNALHAGRIVAVKGIGGYHLACRPDRAGVARLRTLKARDEKPFALMVRDLEAARRLAVIDPDAERVLTGPARPIVLLPAVAESPAAPGNPWLGLMLPYTPLHHLLLESFDALVMTSANLADEPLCHTAADAATRLPRLADHVLDHDRPIHVPVDDSVVRVVDGRELPVRRSRGYAPLPVSLGVRGPVTLGVGGELKTTCCLVTGGLAFVSAHIGDMGSPDTNRAFERAAARLETLYGVNPAVVAADAHPGYLTRSWAERHTGEPGEPDLELVQHHHAHVVSLLAEHGRLNTAVLGVAFDGTGYGDDGTIWGGEFLRMGRDSSRYDRVAHLRPVPLPGGDAAVRNPCRIALAHLRDAGVEWGGDLPPVTATSAPERAATTALLANGVPCSSAGRLFDAVASLLDVRQRIGYEGQAAIELEHLASRARCVVPLPLPVGADGVLDQRPLVRALVEGLRNGSDRAGMALGFHEALAAAVTEVAVRAGERTVGLTGGVFQNLVLHRACVRALTEARFEVLVHRRLPPNDGGLSVGQAVVAALRRSEEQSCVSESRAGSPGYGTARTAP